jgi:6-phosphogluconolactonase
MADRPRAAFYAGVGPVLTRYDLDLDDYALVERGAITLPNNVHYAWRHSDRPILYVGCSSRLNRDNVGTDHTACALRIDPETGALSPLGEPVRLPHRPVHVTCDAPTTHFLAAFNKPGGVAVLRVEDDGALGGFVAQRPDLDAGVFPHQVRVTPDNRHCVVVARGNPGNKGWWAHKGRQQDAGFLKVFAYEDGVLGAETSITVGDGFEFGPRHLDFHPIAPWVYLSLETQNEALVYALDDTGGIGPAPLQRLSTLESPDDVLVRQGAGTVHVHPRGHVVYFANRGHEPMPYRGRRVVTGVENSFVVYAIDPATGRLRLIQRVDAGGICPRTFGLDPTGRMLVAANAETRWVRNGAEVREVSANLSTFKVHDDGRLELMHRYDVALPPGRAITWGGVVAY